MWRGSGGGVPPPIAAAAAPNCGGCCCCCCQPVDMSWLRPDVSNVLVFPNDVASVGVVARADDETGGYPGICGASSNVPNATAPCAPEEGLVAGYFCGECRLGAFGTDGASSGSWYSSGVYGLCVLRAAVAKPFVVPSGVAASRGRGTCPPVTTPPTPPAAARLFGLASMSKSLHTDPKQNRTTKSN